MNINGGALSGNLTRDPQVRFLPSGQAVCEMGIAVNCGYKDKETGEWKDRASFFDMKCFGGMAEWAGENLSKGQKVFVEYALDQEKWTDKESGQQRSKVVLKILTLDTMKTE